MNGCMDVKQSKFQKCFEMLASDFKITVFDHNVFFNMSVIYSVNQVIIKTGQCR